MKQQGPTPPTGSRAKRHARLLKLYQDITKKLSTGRRYRDPHCSALCLARELNVSQRDISTAIATHFGDNYNALINSYRLRDARKMLCSSRHAQFTAEEIGIMSGFSSRQSFYTAFNRAFHCTPKQYRTTGTTAAPSEKDA